MLFFTVHDKEFFFETSMKCDLFAFKDTLLTANRVLCFFNSIFIVFKRIFAS